MVLAALEAQADQRLPLAVPVSRSWVVQLAVPLAVLGLCQELAASWVVQLAVPRAVLGLCRELAASWVVEWGLQSAS